MIAIALSTVSEASDSIRQCSLVGDDRTPVAERAEILRGVEAERARNTDRPDRAARGGRQMRLAAVFDEREMVACRDALERHHVGGLAVQMDRQDRSCPRPDGPLDGAGIEGQAIRIDVGEYRARPRHHDGERRVRGRERRRDDLVAGTNPEPAKDERDGIGASPDADGVRRTRRGSKLRLEGLNLGAEHEPAAGDDPIDGLADVRVVIARHERHERHAPRAHARSSRCGSVYWSKCAR